MHISVLYKCFKFGALWFINEGVTGKKLRWATRFNLHFRCLLAPKLLVGSENICRMQKLNGQTLSACKVWWRSVWSFFVVCLSLLSRIVYKHSSEAHPLCALCCHYLLVDSDAVFTTFRRSNSLSTCVQTAELSH